MNIYKITNNDNELYLTKQKTTEEAKHWVINHLDTSDTWNITLFDSLIAELAYMLKIKDQDELNTLTDLADNDDFFIEVDGAEYRIIHDDVILETFREEMRECIEDSYDIDVPGFVEIDWRATINNCLQDGYGLHFSSYDGSELNCGNYYIFRTN